MRIDAINRVYNSYSTQMAAGVKAAEKAKSKDQVALSSQAKDFASIVKMMEKVPDVREEKVQEIKEKMNSGNYDVSTREVAGKILSQYDFRG